MKILKEAKKTHVNVIVQFHFKRTVGSFEDFNMQTNFRMFPQFIDPNTSLNQYVDVYCIDSDNYQKLSQRKCKNL